MDLKSIRC
jgi:hypothetical protein